MLKRYHRVIGSIFRFADALIISIAWLISYWARFEIEFVPVVHGFPGFTKYAALLPLIVILWQTVFSAMKVYGSKRILRRTDEAYLIARAHLLALLIFIALTYLFSEYRYSRAVMMTFSIAGGLGLVIFRLFLRNTLRSLRRRGYNLRHVIAVGEGGSLEAIIEKIQKFPELGLRIVGAVTDPKSNTQAIRDVPVIGHFDEVDQIVARMGADQVFIALSREQFGQLDSILKKLNDSTAEIRLLPDIHEYVTLGCEVEDFDGFPIVNLNDSPLNGWGAFSKRLMDIAVSGVALLILAIPLGIVAFVIRLTSRGPIFYHQVRMGLDGQTFSIIKFRTMAVDAEAATGPVWAKAGDQRRTILGSFLRSSNIDELPQLWNILKGEMSLVGPRPERPVFVDRFRSEIPHYMLRHKVKAGLTGWAQVNGWRGDTSLAHRIEHDLYYIRHWSFGFDVRILILTLWKGFKNAY